MHRSFILVLLQLFAAIVHINAQPLRHLSLQLHQPHVPLHHHREDPKSSLPIQSLRHNPGVSDFKNIAEIPVEPVVSLAKLLSSESFKSSHG